MRALNSSRLIFPSLLTSYKSASAAAASLFNTTPNFRKPCDTCVRRCVEGFTRIRKPTT